MAVFISTSDEMLPILISNAVPAALIVKILALKVSAAVSIGLLLDVVSPKISLLKPRNLDVETLLPQSGLQVRSGYLAVGVAPFVKNHFVCVCNQLAVQCDDGRDRRGAVCPFYEPDDWSARQRPVRSGWFPTVRRSPAGIVTQLYLENAIGFGAMMSGVMSGAGVGPLVLFRVNPLLKENLLLAAVLYFSGVVTGTLIDLWR